MSDDTTPEAPADDTQEEPANNVPAEWVGEYPEGATLFGSTFKADDFDADYGEVHPDGTTVAVRRVDHRPPPGWIRRHAHLSDLQRTFAILEMHASPKALDIIDSLTAAAWNDFVTAWGKDGALIQASGDGKIAGK